MTVEWLETTTVVLNVAGRVESHRYMSVIRPLSL